MNKQKRDRRKKVTLKKRKWGKKRGKKRRMNEGKVQNWRKVGMSEEKKKERQKRRRS